MTGALAGALAGALTGAFMAEVLCNAESQHYVSEHDRDALILHSPGYQGFRNQHGGQTLHRKRARDCDLHIALFPSERSVHHTVPTLQYKPSWTFCLFDTFMLFASARKVSTLLHVHTSAMLPRTNSVHIVLYIKFMPSCVFCPFAVYTVLLACLDIQNTHHVFVRS